MDTNPNVLIIPYWVKDVLDHIGQSPSDLFDYSKVKQALSQEEQAVLIASQSTALSIFKPEELGANPWALQTSWETTHADEINPVKDLASKLSSNPGFTQELLTRYSAPVVNNYTTNKFNVIDMSTDCAGVVIYPNMLYQGLHVNRSDLYELVQGILMQFHSRMAFDQVAQLPIYNTYFKLMQQSQ